MIVLAKDNGGADVYSGGDESDPIAAPLTLNGSGSPATVSVSPATDIFVYAEDDTGTIGGYTGISIAISGSDAGITWELSTDGVSFSSSINLSDLDVSSTAQAVQIYARCTAVNDGSLATQFYATADFAITATAYPDA